MIPVSLRAVQFLLAEDDDDHADLIYRSLAENRIANQVARVTDGQAVMDYLRKQSPYEEAVVPDVVLLDIRLPKKDGTSVLAEMRDDPRLQRIPVVMLTTSSSETDRAKMEPVAANSYVVKPVDFDRFHKMILDLGLSWFVSGLSSI